MSGRNPFSILYLSWTSKIGNNASRAGGVYPPQFNVTQ